MTSPSKQFSRLADRHGRVELVTAIRVCLTSDDYELALDACALATMILVARAQPESNANELSWEIVRKVVQKLYESLERFPEFYDEMDDEQL